MTGDQQWPTYEPGEESSGGEPSAVAGTHVPYGAPAPAPNATELSVRTSRPRRSGVLVVGVLVVVLAVGVAIVVGQTGDGSDPTDTTTSLDAPAPPALAPPEEAPPDVLSPDGYDELVAAVRDRTGATRVFEAVLYPEYAVLEVPVDRTTRRKESIFWDGEFGDQRTTGTASGERLDLAAVDPALLVSLVARVRRLVDDPTSSYVIIRGRSTLVADDGARIRAYATNEFSESAYLATRLDGTVVRRVTP